MRQDQTSANSNLLSKQTELDNTQCRINESNPGIRDKGTVTQWYIRHTRALYVGQYTITYKYFSEYTVSSQG